MNQELIRQQLQELQLIQCSILPTERFIFLDNSMSWKVAMEEYAEDPIGNFNSLECPPFLGIRVDGAKIWFEIRMAQGGDAGSDVVSKPSISVKGEDISRAEQERWKALVADKMEEISDSELELQSTRSSTQARENEPFHVLFTSHHLISPNKRRSLQQWSSSLSLTGFAKVGYPGVIYAKGERASIEEFVDNVKAMQWLALKVRFVEPLPARGSTPAAPGEPRTWKELQKVGEVVEEMRRIGREEYIIEMGIGSAGINSK
ncbi:hypothetical protein BDZ97DRAFT_188208 [Flammula alnicola]|nr:hypothetical protein BDZ97DRAFT_188208 [Flammula alnicola]